MKNKILISLLTFSLSVAMMLGNMASVCAAEITENMLMEEGKTAKPTVTLEKNENGIIKRVVFTNNDETDSMVWYGLATKEELESGFYSRSGSKLGNLKTTSKQFEWLIEEKVSAVGEYYIFAYAENDDEIKSELVVLENCPIKITNTQKEEPILMQKANVTGYLYFPEIDGAEYEYGFVQTRTNGSEWTSTSVLKEEKGMFYFDPQFYDSYYNDWSIEGVSLIKVNVAEYGFEVERVVYSSVDKGDTYIEPQANAPIITLKRDEKGMVTGVTIQNTDEEYSLVCYGVAKKEDIEVGKNIDFLGDYLEPSKTIDASFGWCLPEYTNKAGEYYFVAYASNDKEERSELTVLEEYPIIITDTYMKEPVVYQFDESGKIMNFVDKTSDKYDYAKINITDGNSWTWSLTARNGVYFFNKQNADNWYGEWSIKELGFVKIIPEDTRCVVEQSIYTSLIEKNKQEEKETVTEIFGDVSKNDWFVDAVQYVYDNGLMSGNNGLFNPSGNVTRAQLVTTLYNIQGKPAVTDFRACQELVDVEYGAWYTNAVCWAYNTGVASGNDTTKMFNMNTPVTRQQLATFFYNYAEYKNLDTKVSADISGMKNADQVASYAEKAMKWAVGAGIISGSETTDSAGNKVYDLKPTGTATRAQLSTILQRFCENNNI